MKENANNPRSNWKKDFNFDGKITETVLKNYLSRSMTLSFISNPSEKPEDDLRMIFNTGVKYIARAIIPWKPEIEYADSIHRYKRIIDDIHRMDPDIILEACIFETVWRNCEETVIPEWVFEAFHLPVNKRNFDYQKMIFPDGKYENHWEDGASIPDITQDETQLYFYYRACRYIDAGFECIHWGQVLLIGENDKNYMNYHTLFTLIRDYARINARRHFVLNNAHVHGIIGPDSILLFDFHAWPVRGVIPAGEMEHAPTQLNPQKVVLELNDLDSIFKKSLGGITYSGWHCKSLPYVVELDNGGGFRAGCLNKPYINYRNWGMDGISWFANQPKTYRSHWLDYAYHWVREKDPAGFFMMPGSRPAYIQCLGQISWYHCNSRKTTDYGWDDEETIKSIWDKTDEQQSVIM